MATNEEEALALLCLKNVISIPILSLLLNELSPEERIRKKRKERYESLTEEEKQKRQRKVPAPSLLPPHLSPWYQIYHGNQDQAFVTVTGLDRPRFLDLLQGFTSIFNDYSPYSMPEDGGFVRELPRKDGRGRPRKISSHACLALVLYWTRTTCYQWTLGPFFGI